MLSPSDDYPRRPQPLLTLPTGLTPEAGSSDTPGVESEEVRAIRAAQTVKDWADRDPDDDAWEGFYLSLDLLEPLEEEVV